MAGFPKAGDEYGGRYRIVRQLGHGGMGIVYEAVDTVLNRPIALKIVLPSLTDRDTYQSRFAREAAVLAKIRSRHIVGIHEYGEHEDTVFFVTELFPDGDLSSWLTTHGPLDRRASLMLVAQVCEALADAHAAQVIHRDVKPGNVLLWSRPEGLIPYLCDFGIAVDGQQSLTRTGTLIGSPAYMAPERHFGHDADERGDIYSVGCLLWACLTGEAPYHGTDFQVMNSHINEPVPALGTGDPIDDEIDAVLAGTLEKDPAKRIPSADRLRQQLLGIVNKLDASARALPPIPPGVRGQGSVSGRTTGARPLTGPQTVVRNVPVTPPPPPGTRPQAQAGRPPKPPREPRAKKTRAEKERKPPVARPAGEPGSRKQIIAVAAGIAALLVIGGVAYAAVLGSGDDDPGTQPTAPTTTPDPATSSVDATTAVAVITAPEPPELSAAPGYRSVQFTLGSPPKVEGATLSMQVRSDKTWAQVGRRVVVPAAMGGRQVCVQARAVATALDGSDSKRSDTVRQCGRARPATVAFIRTDDPCVNSVGGPCTWYDVRVSGFPSGANPPATVRRVDGGSWCNGCAWKRVQVGKDGRGYLRHDWKISRDEGEVILDVMGVTGRFHLYYAG